MLKGYIGGSEVEGFSYSKSVVDRLLCDDLHFIISIHSYCGLKLKKKKKKNVGGY